jgi:hypothetical protein
VEFEERLLENAGKHRSCSLKFFGKCVWKVLDTSEKKRSQTIARLSSWCKERGAQ